MNGRGMSVGVASVIGSFFVYGAHLACGGGRLAPRVVGSAPAQTVAPGASAPETATSSITGSTGTTGTDGKKSDCGCSTPRLNAYFVAAGDEKITIDPLDAQASLEVSYGRTTAGKKQIVLSGIVRAYRSDVAAERPTTLAIRIAYPEGTTPSSSSATGGASSTIGGSSPKEVEAHLTTWGAGAVVAPRVYAAVAKSALTVTVTDTLVEIRGSLTLKDPPTGRSIVLDKLLLRKTGTALLPERNGIFHP
jgi:hypothetical protein